jgi:predicted dehydrogenase
MLQGALLGVGNVAVNGHLPGWRARRDVTFAAAADARTDGKAAFLEAFPPARWYAAAEDLLSAERTLDFADIAAPPALHAPLIRQSLAAGLHVLCEKPLVLSSGEIPELAALAQQRGRVLVPVHNWKHAPALAKVTELVASGAVGEVRRCRWETLRTRPAVAAGDQGNWRVDPAQSGGGILMDHGWHALYMVAGWLGTGVRSVRASLTTRKHRSFAIEDTAAVTLEYASSTAEIFLTWAADERANRIALEGTRGRITLDGGHVRLVAGAVPQDFDLASIAEGSHHPDWFGGVVEDFVSEIGDPARRGAGLAEASFCASMMALSLESQRRGGLPVASA